MIELILTVIFLIFLCQFFKSKPEIHTRRGVSVSRPPWCPVTEDDCSSYMRSKVDKSLLKYLNRIDDEDENFILSEQHALESISIPNDSIEHKREFVRVFQIQFRAHLPRIQLAKRLGEPLSKYVKLNNERSLVQGI